MLPETAEPHIEAAPANAGPKTDAPALECRNLSISYGGDPVVRDLDLVVARGETLALLGPSGCGKTTLLHAIAGFLTPSAGEILVHGRLVASPRAATPPEGRSAAMVFQNYALWPHLSALDNVAYPLRRAGLRKKAARAEAFALLDRLGIAQLATRRPAQLSGGQQQRVGVARALARRAHITLLDEPTAHLDQTLRGQVQDEIARVIGAAQRAVVYATHDPAEALGIADHVALLRAGELLQVGAPREIYEAPRDLWAARLTGPASVVKGDIADDGRVIVSARARGWLIVRPEWAALGGELAGRVDAAHFRGAYTDYSLDTVAGRVVVRDDAPPTLTVGEVTTWRLHHAWPLTCIADVDQRSSASTQRDGDPGM